MNTGLIALALASALLGTTMILVHISIRLSRIEKKLDSLDIKGRRS